MNKKNIFKGIFLFPFFLIWKLHENVALRKLHVTDFELD